MHMRTKIESYLGFARKAGKLMAGFHPCEAGMKKKQIRLLIICEDTATNTKDKAISLAQTTETTFRVLGHSDWVGRSSGSMGRTLFGITDPELAQAILREMELEERNQTASAEKEDIGS